MTSDLFRLDGKRALVTGGTKGIGLGIAKGLARAGADLILISRNRAELERTRNDLAAPAQAIHIFEFDLQNTDSLNLSRRRRIIGISAEVVEEAVNLSNVSTVVIDERL